MKLFYVEAEREQDERVSVRTWLVVAGSLFEAMSLVPDGYAAKSIEVRPDPAPGPARVIGWMGPPPPPAYRSSLSEPDSPIYFADQRRPDRALQHHLAGRSAQPGL